MCIDSTVSAGPRDQSTRSLPLYAIGAGYFAVGIAAFVVVGVLGPLQRDLGLTRAEAGALLTTYALAYAVASPVLARMTGHLDRRTALLLGLGLCIIGSGVSALAARFDVLLAARIPTALGAALFTPVASAVAIGIYAARHPAKALGIVISGLTLSQIAGVLLGSYLGYARGWRSDFLAVAVLSALAVPILCLTVARGMRVPASSRSSLTEVLRAPRLMIVVGLTALFMSAVFTIYAFIGPMMEARFGLGAEDVTMFLLVLGLAQSLTTRSARG
jgi:DHA1 family inner membrane transport protein